MTVQRWGPGEDAREKARVLEGVLSEAIFEDLSGTDRVVRRHGVWSIEDPTELEGAAKDLYDPETWPLVYIDGLGRRFEIDVEVRVRPLPPVEVQVAERRADIAALNALDPIAIEGEIVREDA